MRKIAIILGLLSLAAGGWWLSTNQDITGYVQQYVESSDFVTLKARYSPDQIMEAHRKELLIDEQHSFQEPSIKFHPYLLMDVKYSMPDKKSREGVIYWSLVDGEMVVNTENWEKTHGFEDAINAGASRNDFKIMFALAKNKGSATIEQLQKELHVEKETFQPWINSALAKHLILQNGSFYQLHFQDPKILVNPETKVGDWLVKKPYNYAQRVSTKYSNAQIQKIAKAAFGDDFSIRLTSEIFLPVYSIEVLTPDGAVFTTYWNALTGQKLPNRL